jgi:hypothetical protein
VTPSQPLPLSDCEDVYCDLDQRPVTLGKYVALRDAGVPRPSDAIMVVSLSEILVSGVVVYEMVVYHVSSTRDNRCIVAGYRSVDRAQDRLPFLIAGWFQSYGGPLQGRAPRISAPCPN